MTFSARFETVDLSDFFPFHFCGFLMKGDGGDGDIKGGVKGTKGGVQRTKEKGGAAITEVSR